MQKTLSRVELVANIARAWTEAGINYAISHGVEDYPEDIGRDIDIAIDANQVAAAIDIAVPQLQQAGFIVTEPPQPWNWRGRWLSAFRDGEQVALDFLPFLIWGPVLLVSTPHPNGNIGPFPTDSWATFGKRVMLYVLTKRTKGLPKRPWIDATEDAHVRKGCERLMGAELTDKLLNALKAGEEEGLLAVVPAIRKEVMRRAMLRRPRELLGVIRPFISRQIRPHFVGIAPIIALVGPDGVGKTSTIAELKEIVPDPLLNLVVNHWRPKVLTRLGAYVGNPAPKHDEHGMLPPRRKPGRFHYLRIMYYWLDYVLGHYIKDKKRSSRLSIICYDRYAIDMQIDPIRYGLSSRKGTKWLWRNVPKPDLVILLYDDPERIYARKPELPPDELDGLLKDWLKLAESGDIDAIIHIDAPPPQIAARIMELVMNKFIEKYGIFTDTQSPRQWIGTVLTAPSGD